MKNTVVFVFSVAALLFCMSPGNADSAPAPSMNTATVTGQEYSINVPDYSMISENDLAQASNTLLAQNDAFLRNLLKQYHSNKLSNAQKSELIFLLGNMEIEGGVDDLINDIAFLDKHPLGFTYQIRGGYAAQKALARIGKYSFDEIMEVMSNRKKDVPFVAANAEAYAWVLWAIEGKHCALFKLNERLANEKSPKVRSQYMMVIKWVNAGRNEN